jgi:MFS family permease
MYLYGARATSGAILIVGSVISAEAVEPVKRGTAIGAYRTFFDLGSFVGPILMVAVMTRYDVKTTFYISSVLLCITIPLVFRLKEIIKVEGELIAH